MRVLIAGGGTAGHVFPALAVADRLVEQGHEVRFAGTADGQEGRLVPAAGFAFTPIEASPFLRTLSPRALAAPVVALRSVSRARPLVEGADVVLGMGGYVSLPVGLAALRARRPLVLHEQNAVPGLANRVLARPARAVALAFIEAARLLPGRARTVVTGNPVRGTVLTVHADRARLREEAYRTFELDPTRRTILVFGGSQGALHVNRAIAETVARWRGSDTQFLVLAGAAHEGEVRAAASSSEVPVRVHAFLERMELAYAIADLVVARAGATTVAEVAVCGIASLLIPYPYATGRHQDANARALQRAGAATVLLDDDLDGAVLLERLRELLATPDELARMGERARAWSKPGAGDSLARAVVSAGGAG